MTDEMPYTNREIKQMFDSQNATLARIEKMIADEFVPLKKEVSTILLWKEGLMGKLSMLVIVVGFLGELIMNWISNHIGQVK